MSKTQRSENVQWVANVRIAATKSGSFSTLLKLLASQTDFSTRVKRGEGLFKFKEDPKNYSLSDLIVKYCDNSRVAAEMIEACQNGGANIAKNTLQRVKDKIFEVNAWHPNVKAARDRMLDLQVDGIKSSSERDEYQNLLEYKDSVSLKAVTPEAFDEVDGKSSFSKLPVPGLSAGHPMQNIMRRLREEKDIIPAEIAAAPSRRSSSGYSDDGAAIAEVAEVRRGVKFGGLLARFRAWVGAKITRRGRGVDIDFADIDGQVAVAEKNRAAVQAEQNSAYSLIAGANAVGQVLARPRIRAWGVSEADIENEFNSLAVGSLSSITNYQPSGERLLEGRVTEVDL